jgi:hypothetical protein
MISKCLFAICGIFFENPKRRITLRLNSTIKRGTILCIIRPNICHIFIRNVNNCSRMRKNLETKVQTCTSCHTQSLDTVVICPTCQSDLKAYSTTAVALKKFRQNPRIKTIRVATPEGACPICVEIQGTYSKGDAPILPIEGCSNANGCCAFYEPVITDIYP